MKSTINISGKSIGDNEPAFIIDKIEINHIGNLLGNIREIEIANNDGSTKLYGSEIPVKNKLR